MASDEYLIWSAEHAAWWGPGANGYVRRLSQAGRYTRAGAIAICAQSVPGTSQMMGALPELPVRLEDVEEVVRLYKAEFPGRDTERWE